MKKFILMAALVLSFQAATADEPITLTTNGKNCTVNILLDRDLGPGIRYTRMRLPEYPLNVNMLRVDVTNPYNRMVTTQANNRLYSTESLVKAAARQDKEGHRILAGTNANFWCVAPQLPFSDFITGYTYNGNVVNGKTVSNLNMYSDQWNGGYKHTGIVGFTPAPDKKAVSSNNWTWKGFARNDKFGSTEIINVNRTVRANELGMFNSFYGTSRAFLCVDQYEDNTGKQRFREVKGAATEVYFKLDEDQEWSNGRDMTFTVMQIKQNVGDGTLGSYDMALVGRDGCAALLDKLAIGDKVTVLTTYYDPSGKAVELENLVGGNAQIMVNGALTTYATSETYNSQVYSRTCMGTDADGKTLYMLVADKATDPFYGASAGCPASVICDIAKLFGCVNMTNFDAGGSAEFFLEGAIVNRTTEGTPRAVANGLLAVSTAPTDNNITRIAFYDCNLKAPVYSSYRPRIIAYNKYGAVVSDNITGFTLSCPAEAGTCDGDIFTAGGEKVKSTLTATLGNISITAPIEIMGGEATLRIKPVVIINHKRRIPMDVTTEVDGKTYTYDPANVDYTIGDNTIASIGADGILAGIKEGETELTASVGTFSDKTTVKVQIADRELMPLSKGALNPAEWKCTGSGITSSTIVLTPAEGSQSCAFGVDYTVSGTRSVSFTLTRDEDLYSLPEKFRIVINPGTAKINRVTLRLQPANAERPVSIAKAITLNANEDNNVDIDLTEFGDISDAAFYPVTFNSAQFGVGDGKGTYHIDIRGIGGLHSEFDAGVTDITADPSAEGPVRLYNLQGIEMGSHPAPGIYLRRQGCKTSKVIIK